jgi:hypothetical protein
VNSVLKSLEAGWVVICHPSRLPKRHLGGTYDCLADCRWLHCSRDRHDRPVVDYLSTLDGHSQLVLREHQVLAVVVAAVLPFLRDRWV